MELLRSYILTKTGKQNLAGKLSRVLSFCSLAEEHSEALF